MWRCSAPFTHFMLLPQVTFNVDANGILTVSALEKGSPYTYLSIYYLLRVVCNPSRLFLQVTFNVNANGILTVSALEKGGSLSLYTYLSIYLSI